MMDPPEGNAQARMPTPVLQVADERTEAPRDCTAPRSRSAGVAQGPHGPAGFVHEPVEAGLAGHVRACAATSSQQGLRWGTVRR